MKFTKNKLREVKIFNDIEFANGEVCIIYFPQETGRMYRSACWRIHKGQEQTDPEAHWTDHGKMTFLVTGYINQQAREAALNKAQQWASEKYGITEWGKNPFGSWMDKNKLEQRLAQLTARYKALGVKENAN